MSSTIRLLQDDDKPLVEAMDTGIENDYVLRVFDRLSREPNRIYGLFQDGQLVSIGGISIYANTYAMLGRIRTDRRFKKKGYASEIMSYIKDVAFRDEKIQWVGANTQEENLPARRVMEKIGLSEYTMLHGALTKNTSMLESGAMPWRPVTELERRKKWIHQTFIEPGNVFPYECYYPFPATANLFPDHELRKWTFYENADASRFLITKPDQKKHQYLHVIYPWSDLSDQEGLWETISRDYRQLANQTGEETYIWMDLTKEEAQTLPADHAFILKSPWILYGKNKSK
ncbi:GNAT family N-acetyltransferase [Virgibacillus siamensis]|uniref:GNAT family N-acetyltransferase n=1 Tax=Virgibacillus siamensis TaxID=480071 RepID=UPI00098543E9|nr:GNAT family N-acetyltransferase [Virgibacillus siamensis]